MPNLVVKSDGSVVQKTHIARTHDKDQSYELVALPESETKMSLLGNLFLSNGKIFIIQKNTRWTVNNSALWCMLPRNHAFFLTFPACF